VAGRVTSVVTNGSCAAASVFSLRAFQVSCTSAQVSSATGGWPSRRLRATSECATSPWFASRTYTAAMLASRLARSAMYLRRSASFEASRKLRLDAVTAATVAEPTLESWSRIRRSLSATCWSKTRPRVQMLSSPNPATMTTISSVVVRIILTLMEGPWRFSREAMMPAGCY
jgi:hypothetical protein